MDESKLIFFTGAPGSKWSAISEVLTNSPLLEIDTSDRNEQRVYSHGEKFNNVQHLGSYFGPGMEFGEKWDMIDTLSKDEILSEIDKAFTDTESNKFRIIKCHQFVNNLDYIKEIFPSSKIIIITRPVESCYKGWFGSGGFDITYPVYKPYYKNEAGAKRYIEREVKLAEGWIKEKKLRKYRADEEHWTRFWGFKDLEPQSYIDNYIKSIEGYLYSFDNKPSYDTYISYYGFPGL
jgi:hypothetical protein